MISEKYHAELLCIGCIGLQSLHFLTLIVWCISTLSSKSNASTCSFSANRNVQIISYSQSDFSSGHDTSCSFLSDSIRYVKNSQDSLNSTGPEIKKCWVRQTQRQTGWKTSLDVKPLVGHPGDYEEFHSATQAEIKEQICGNPYSQHSNGLLPKAQVHLSKRVDRSSLPNPSSACALYLCMCVFWEDYLHALLRVTHHLDGRWPWVGMGHVWSCEVIDSMCVRPPIQHCCPKMLQFNGSIPECCSLHIWTKQSGDLIFQGDAWEDTTWDHLARLSPCACLLLAVFMSICLDVALSQLYTCLINLWSLPVPAEGELSQWITKNNFFLNAISLIISNDSLS